MEILHKSVIKRNILFDINWFFIYDEVGKVYNKIYATKFLMIL